ncbi:DUF1049 domain-containing protein [Croceicoccus sp. F390]|uniref:DUF1049 domain-containing protein n=1 Tax=Croceicoccus esteveae TaxID=3075597 RepID=A0ABU2ZK22_9SPHN|nr:DUF1049 domain-containing protein [Croceicoccus sp. F390]MDT0576664.1 DUF1049 domain-containing protein [Croceicoccus sp. F390]
MMQVLRTIIWVLLVAALAFFAAFNWVPVDVAIWDNLVLETKLPVVMLVAFLIGLAPMWMYHRTARWRLHRRIGALEASNQSLLTNSLTDQPPMTAGPDNLA